MSEQSLLDEPPIETGKVLDFVDKGLLGFEEYLRYCLVSYDAQTPFYWLEAVENPELAFLVVEPRFLLPDYAFDLPDEEAQLLGIESSEQVLVLVLLTVPEDPMAMTANLLGPLIFHRESLQGRQIVLENQDYPLRYPVFSEGFSEDMGEEA